jgi:hypothetical protein
VFACGVDLNIALRDTFEQCSHLPLNILMILIFILEETHGAYKYFRTEMVRRCFKKRNKPDAPEAVIQEAVRAVQQRRLPLRVAASRYGITHTALH